MKSSFAFALLALYGYSSALPQSAKRDGKAQQQETLYASPVPIQPSQPTLRPLIDTSYAGTQEALALQRTGQLFFSSSGNGDAMSPGMAARLSMNFQFPSLILDHALESYQSVSCDGRVLSLIFHDQRYYNFVKAEWSQHQDIVVITSHSGCASYSDGSHHTYFKGTQLRFTDSDLGLTLVGVHADLHDIIDDAHLEFGQFDHLPSQQQTVQARAIGKSTSSSLKATTSSSTTKAPSAAAKTTTTTSSVSKGASSKSSATTSNTSTLKTSTKPASSSTALASTSTTGAAQCGSLPSSTISGMPAASCGAGFDQILDNGLGYYAFDDSNFADTWAAIAPGADTSAFYNPADLTTPPAKRDLLAARKITLHFSLVAAVKSIATSVAAKVVSTVQTVAKTVAALPSKIVSAAKAVVSFVAAVVEGHPSVTLSVPMSWHWGGVDNSPWGFAKLVHVFKETTTSNGKNMGKEKEEKTKEAKELLPDNLGDLPHIAIYCVQCGFNGSFKATGAIGFNIHGITNATLDMVGDLDLSLGIGIDALALKTIELAKKELFSVGLPGFSIPKIVALGPVLYVQVGASYEMKAIGQLLFQGMISFRNAKTHTDYLNSANSYSTGWKPTLGGKVDVHGELSAGLVFDLPIGVMFGLDVLDGKFKESAVSVVDTSSLEIEAKIELEGSVGASTNDTSIEHSGSLNDDYCTGVMWNVSLHNQLNIDVIGQKNFKIFEVELPVAGGCIGNENTSPTLPSSPSSSPVNSSPGIPGCSITGNLLTNGDFASDQLSPWYVASANSQNTYDTTQGFLTGVQNVDPNGDNPYSKQWFRQDITLCQGASYTFSFDYMFSNPQPYDIYMYGTMYYSDGSTQGIFGDRSYSDQAALGKWEHATNTFVATTGAASFEIGVVACNYESATAYYDNLIIVASPSQSKRSIDERQSATGTDDSYGSTNVQLDQSANGSNENDDDTVNIDNLDPYNADGSVAAPPNDSDIDTAIQTFDSDIAVALNANNDDYLTNLLNTYPPSGGTSSNSTNYSPPLPDAAGMLYQTLPTSDNTAQLSAGVDGNIYFESLNPSSTSGLWASMSGVWAGDFQGRLLHVYSGELNALNVSRLRLSDETNFPITGLLVGLVGIKTGGSNLMAAVDTSGNIYYLASCNLQGQNTKLFVVKDPDAGLAVLQTAVASWTVTGGVVQGNCSLAGINPPNVLVSL